MKKPTRKKEAAPRRLDPAELSKVRGGDGGITALDDWEAPVAAFGNKVWTDDWLAPV